MPQLDKVSFFSQYFWLSVFFFSFYIFQLKFFLPEMSRILKFRKKRLNEASSVGLQQENNKIRNSVEISLASLIRNSKSIFKDSSSKNNEWFSELRIKFYKKFKKGNLNYLHLSSKNSLSKSLAITAGYADFSSKIFSTVLSTGLLSQGSVVKRNYSITRSVPSASTEKKEKNSSTSSNPFSLLKKSSISDSLKEGDSRGIKSKLASLKKESSSKKGDSQQLKSKSASLQRDSSLSKPETENLQTTAKTSKRRKKKDLPTA